MSGGTPHANHHVPKFLSLHHESSVLTDDSSTVVQVLTDGKKLTAKNLVNGNIDIRNPILVTDSPSSIGMKLPPKGNRGRVTVRDIANVIGHAYPVSVIDVRHQEELEGWTMGDLVEYFEDEERLNQASTSTEEQSAASPTNSNRRRRAAASQAREKQQQSIMPKVLNQISLEFSRTPLHDMVKSPQFVRDLDWIDHAWSTERREAEDYPMVQYYCLTSTSGCYTDFHVDFGGTSVWYHVLRGEKKFVLIRPSKENLAVYEDWLCRPNQAALFLPDLMEHKEDILTVSLKEGQTLVIPTGWIHAVYTPADSVVFGGNFLHGFDMSLQLEIHYLETRTRVPDKFRFPFFLALQFYAGGMYLSKLQSNTFMCERELEGLEELIAALEGWWKLQADETLVVAAKDAAKQNGCKSVEEFLTLLKMEWTRRLVKKDAPSSSPERPKLRLKLPSSDVGKPRVGTLSPRDVEKSASEGLHIKLSPPRDIRLKLKLSPPRDVKPAAAVSGQLAAGDSSPNTEKRLNLSSPPRESPKPKGIRLKLSSKADTSSTSSSNFRIVLPAAARPAVAAKKRKSFQREGLDEFIPMAGDDEWEPDVPKKKRSSKMASSLSSGPQAKGGMAKAKKPTSSRQRLMKRFR